MYLVFLELLLW